MAVTRLDSSLKVKISGYIEADKAFPAILDGARTLASTYCDLIAADGTRLA